MARAEKYFMKKSTKDWLNSAESDLLIIEKVSGIKELNHQVAFHSQQVIEKSFKALIDEYELGFVKIHSLETLYNKVKLYLKILINEDMLTLLDQLYIDARYPGEMGLLPDGKPSDEETQKFILFAKNIYAEVYKTVTGNKL